MSLIKSLILLSSLLLSSFSLAKVTNLQKELVTAIVKSDVEAFKEVLPRFKRRHRLKDMIGVDIKVEDNYWKRFTGATPMFLALHAGNIEIIDLLIDQRVFPITAKASNLDKEIFALPSLTYLCSEREAKYLDDVLGVPFPKASHAKVTKVLKHLIDKKLIKFASSYNSKFTFSYSYSTRYQYSLENPTEQLNDCYSKLLDPKILSTTNDLNLIKNTSLSMLTGLFVSNNIQAIKLLRENDLLNFKNNPNSKDNYRDYGFSESPLSVALQFGTLAGLREFLKDGGYEVTPEVDLEGQRRVLGHNEKSLRPFSWFTYMMNLNTVHPRDDFKKIELIERKGARVATKVNFGYQLREEIGPVHMAFFLGKEKYINYLKGRNFRVYRDKKPEPLTLMTYSKDGLKKLQKYKSEFKSGRNFSHNILNNYLLYLFSNDLDEKFNNEKEDLIKMYKFLKSRNVFNEKLIDVDGFFPVKETRYPLGNIVKISAAFSDSMTQFENRFEFIKRLGYINFVDDLTYFDAHYAMKAVIDRKGDVTKEDIKVFRRIKNDIAQIIATGEEKKYLSGGIISDFFKKINLRRNLILNNFDFIKDEFEFLTLNFPQLDIFKLFMGRDVFKFYEFNQMEEILDIATKYNSKKLDYSGFLFNELLDRNAPLSTFTKLLDLTKLEDIKNSKSISVPFNSSFYKTRVSLFSNVIKAQRLDLLKSMIENYGFSPNKKIYGNVSADYEDTEVTPLYFAFQIEDKDVREEFVKYLISSGATLDIEFKERFSDKRNSKVLTGRLAVHAMTTKDISPEFFKYLLGHINNVNADSDYHRYGIEIEGKNQYIPYNILMAIAQKSNAMELFDVLTKHEKLDFTKYSHYRLHYYFVSGCGNSASCEDIYSSLILDHEMPFKSKLYLSLALNYQRYRVLESFVTKGYDFGVDFDKSTFADLVVFIRNHILKKELVDLEPLLNSFVTSGLDLSKFDYIHALYSTNFEYQSGINRTQAFYDRLATLTTWLLANNAKVELLDQNIRAAMESLVSLFRNDKSINTKDNFTILLENGADPNIKFTTSSYGNEYKGLKNREISFLYGLVTLNDLDMVKAFTSSPLINLDEGGVDEGLHGNDIMFAANINRNIEMIEYLISIGKDINVLSAERWGKTILWKTIELTNESFLRSPEAKDYIRQLIALGADINFEYNDNNLLDLAFNRNLVGIALVLCGEGIQDQRCE